MNQAQTPKLTEFEKADLRCFKQENPKAQFATFGRVTVLIVPIGNNGFARMSTAVAADHETKIRRKVGELLCAARFFEGESILVSALQVAAEEAEILAGFFPG